MSTPDTGTWPDSQWPDAAVVSHRGGPQQDTNGQPGVTARPPVAAAAAAPLGVLFAVVLGALGVLGVRDGLVAAGALGGTPWIASAITNVNGVRPQTWMLPAGIVAVLVGLWWVLVALKPRRRTAVQLVAETSVWMRPTDLARVASAAAEDVPAVASVTASGKRHKLTLKVSTSARDGAQVRAHVQEAVTARLHSVATAPRIKVKTRTSGES